MQSTADICAVVSIPSLKSPAASSPAAASPAALPQELARRVRAVRYADLGLD